MTAVIEELKQSPRLGIYVRQLQDVLRREAGQRDRFYREFNEQVKAEFINGEVIVHSPARLKHTTVVGQLFKLLSTYVVKNDLGIVRSEKLMISLTRNDYEPDIVFFNKRKASGFNPDQLHFPAPDFVVEVLSDSTATIDRGVKFDDFAGHGVSEYWIVDPDTRSVEQYRLRNDEYELVSKLTNGMIESVAITGFTISVSAIFDAKENINALGRILKDG